MIESVTLKAIEFAQVLTSDKGIVGVCTVALVAVLLYLLLKWGTKLIESANPLTESKFEKAFDGLTKAIEKLGETAESTQKQNIEAHAAHLEKLKEVSELSKIIYSGTTGILESSSQAWQARLESEARSRAAYSELSSKLDDMPNKMAKEMNMLVKKATNKK